MQINYEELFHHIQPDFFDQPHIRSLPEEHVFREMVLALSGYSPDAVTIDVPSHITYSLYTGNIGPLHESIREVDPDWAQYFQPGDPVFCAFDGEKVVSFCLLDDFGEYQGLRIGAPGCVGTVPSYRKMGIGLRMVQLATQELKERGYDLSYIHYTSVDRWYARLGYENILYWNCKGIVR